LLSPINIFSISALTDTENYQSVWHQTHYDIRAVDLGFEPQ
jgi:hypothetical protein